jgi:hypothetical protein
VVLAGTLVDAWIASQAFTTWVPFQDYRFHAALAGRVHFPAPLEVPHPLFHWLTAAVLALWPAGGAAAAAFLVVVASQAALLAVLCARIRQALASVVPVRAATLAGAAVLGLAILTPITFLVPGRREIYFGYLYPNTYHNPTVLLLRPLAVLLSACCAAAWTSPETRPPRVLALAAVTVASALAKPSHLMCFVPAVAALWVLERLLRRGSRPSWTPILGVVLPGLAVMAWQYWFTVASGRMEEGELVWAPLAAVFVHTQPNVPLVVLKVVLSIAFPLWVAVSVPKALRETELALAWIAFAVSLVLAYGFAEGGPRLAHGNLLWSGQVATFVLFAVSAAVFLKEAGSQETIGRAAGAALFLVHVASGIAYAVRFVRSGQPF